jgi:sugar/nucleoside kinase (ribokinase family)
VDPNWDSAGRWEGHLADLLAECDVFLPNESEVARISGVDDPELAISEVAPRTPFVAVKQGSEGASLRWSGRVWHGSAPAVEVVDTTGAGDSFNAGFLYGFLQGWQPGEVLALALACGSLSTRGYGGTGAQPHLDAACALAATVTVREEAG